VLVTSTIVPAQANATYASNLPVRGDCIDLVVGIPDIKNLG
jgi:hypothetical protein